MGRCTMDLFVKLLAAESSQIDYAYKLRRCR